MTTTIKETLIEITALLRDFGMPSHVKGFYYVREAIYMVYDDTSLLNNFMNAVYAPIAELNNVSVQCVERSMRAAIEITWLRGDSETIAKIFHNTIDGRKARPTNKEFVALIVDHIKIKHM